jgi:hypothetical protein
MGQVVHFIFYSSLKNESHKRMPLHPYARRYLTSSNCNSSLYSENFHNRTSLNVIKKKKRITTVAIPLCIKKAYQLTLVVSTTFFFFKQSVQ